ncbi:acyl-CoA carboxylase subunit beta [Chloroflexota bacterium]
MQDRQRAEAEELAGRYKVPPEYVKAILATKRAATMRDKLEAFNQERTIMEQGAPDAIRRQHENGKLTARERVNKLLDPDSFRELDLWQRPIATGFDIGEDSAQGDGVITGFGEVDERPVSIWAQDATVLDGTVGTVHARKISVIMDDAINARTPIVGIFDSVGIRAHDAIQYPDFFSTPRLAYLQTLGSGVIPKISLVMGQCSGELSIVAGLADFVFMVRNTSYMHIAPPPPGMSNQELGDAWNIHAKVTGCCDVLADDDGDCLQKCRQLLSFLPLNNMEMPPVVDTGDDPNRREEELMELVPIDSSKPYSMYRLISLVVDNSEFFEIRRHWARNLITGFARLEGRTVGIIANNPQDKGGCMNLDAADKMSHLVRFCDAFNIPLIWLTDTPAFLPAIDEEARGLIRHGSGMIMANSEATVPQVNIAIRKRYGGAANAMPTTNLGGDLGVAWPTYEPGSMGARGAVAIIHRRELAAITDETQRKKRENRLTEDMQWGLDRSVRAETQMIIDPRDTRPYLIKALKWLRNRKQEWLPKKHENIRI